MHYIHDIQAITNLINISLYTKLNCKHLKSLIKTCKNKNDGKTWENYTQLLKVASFFSILIKEENKFKVNKWPSHYLLSLFSFSYIFFYKLSVSLRKCKFMKH
jgi:hypothetical protein